MNQFINQFCYSCRPGNVHSDGDHNNTIGIHQPDRRRATHKTRRHRISAEGDFRTLRGGAQRWTIRVNWVCVCWARQMLCGTTLRGRSELSLMRQQRCLVTREMIYYFTFAGDFVFEERLEEVSGYWDEVLSAVLCTFKMHADFTDNKPFQRFLF